MSVRQSVTVTSPLPLEDDSTLSKEERRKREQVRKKLDEEVAKFEKEKEDKRKKKGRPKSLLFPSPVIVKNFEFPDFSEEQVNAQYEKLLLKQGVSQEEMKRELKKGLKSKKHIVEINSFDTQYNVSLPDPSEIIELIKSTKSLADRSKYVVEKIYVNLRTAPMYWVQMFLDAGGLLMLTSTLNLTNLMSGSKIKEDLILQATILDCYREIIDTAIGKEEFLSEKDNVRNLTLLLDNDDINARKTVLILLATLLQTDTDDDLGLKLVDDAFSYFRLVKGDKERFSSLVQSMTKIDDEDYLARVFYLFNSLLTSSPTEAHSWKFIKEFENLDIKKLISKLPKYSTDSSLATQINVFFNEMSDPVDLSESFKDAIGIATLLQTNTIGTDIYTHLMNILLHLHSYSKLGFESSFRDKQSTGWEVLERLLKVAVTKNKDGSVSKTDPEVIRLEMEIEKFQKEILNMETRMGDIKVEKSLMKQEVENLTCAIDGFKMEISILTQEVSGNNTLIDVLKRSLENEKKKVETLKVQLEDSKRVNPTRKEDSSDLKRDLEEQTNKIRELTIEYENLKKKYELDKRESEKLKNVTLEPKSEPKLSDVVQNPESNVDSIQVDVKTLTIVKPPGPPGPPGVPGQMMNTLTFLPNIKPVKLSKPTRKFNFDEIEKKASEKTIFIVKGIAKNHDDVIKNLDLIGLAETFSNKVTIAPPPGSTTSENKKLVEALLLDPKRSNAILLQRGSVRDMDDDALLNAIIQLDEKKINVSNIGTIVDMLPTEEEIQLINAYTGTDPLGSAEKFVYNFSRFPNIKLRMAAFQTKLFFVHNVSVIRNKITITLQSIQELTTDQTFLEFLTLVLTIGNLLNGKIVYSFKMSTLTKLCDTKSSNGKIRLLDYIIQFCENHNNYKEIFYLEKHLSSVPITRNTVFIPSLDQDIDAVENGLKCVTRVLQGGKMNDDDRFEEIMDRFHNEALDTFISIKDKRSEMDRQLDLLCELYSEQKKDVLSTADEKLYEFYKEVCNFLTLFEESKRKLIDDRERQKQDKEKLKKQQEKDEKKRLEEEKRDFQRRKQVDLEGRGEVSNLEDKMKTGQFNRRRRGPNHGYTDDFSPSPILSERNFY